MHVRITTQVLSSPDDPDSELKDERLLTGYVTDSMIMDFIADTLKEQCVWEGSTTFMPRTKRIVIRFLDFD